MRTADPSGAVTAGAALTVRVSKAFDGMPSASIKSAAMPFRLRPARDDDVEAIARLYHDSYRLLNFLPRLHTLTVIAGSPPM